MSFQDTGKTVQLRSDGTYNITVPGEHYVEITITFRVDYGFLPCLTGRYIEFRDGLNQSADLLGILCEAFTKERVFRSSGHNMYLKFHGHIFFKEEDFYINYTARPMNITGLKSFFTYFEVTVVGQFHSITSSSGHIGNPGRGGGGKHSYEKGGILVGKVEFNF